MNRHPLPLLAASVGLLVFGNHVRAADQSAVEAKLRESLRGTTLQLRTIQAERDALQIAKTQLEQEKTDLEQKLAAAVKQLATDKEATDRSLTELRDRVARQGVDLVQLKESLEKWKSSQKEAVTLLQKKESERATLSQRSIELQRKVSDQQARNVKMHQIASEILSRYENFGLGTALSAREPFVGTMKVKLQNLVQDYQDAVDAQKIKP